MKALQHLLTCFVIFSLFGIISSVHGVDPSDYDEALKEDEPLNKESVTEYPNGVNVIPGQADIHYPIYSKIPKSSFSCHGRRTGFYADSELRCQVWHICDEGGVQQSFLCTNGTIYSQEKRVCDWWYNVNCDPEEVNRNYEQNEELYKGPPSKYNKEESYNDDTNDLPPPPPPTRKSNSAPVQSQQRSYEEPQQQRRQNEERQQQQQREPVQQQPRQRNSNDRPQTPPPQQQNQRPPKPHGSPPPPGTPEKKRVIVLRLPGPLPPGATIPPHILMQYAESVLAAERAGKPPPTGLSPNPGNYVNRQPKEFRQEAPVARSSQEPHQQTPSVTPAARQASQDPQPQQPKARPTPFSPIVPYTPRPFSQFLADASRYNGQTKQSTPQVEQSHSKQQSQSQAEQNYRPSQPSSPRPSQEPQRRPSYNEPKQQQHNTPQNKPNYEHQGQQAPSQNRQNYEEQRQQAQDKQNYNEPRQTSSSPNRQQNDQQQRRPNSPQERPSYEEPRRPNPPQERPSYEEPRRPNPTPPKSYEEPKSQDRSSYDERPRQNPSHYQQRPSNEQQNQPKPSENEYRQTEEYTKSKSVPVPQTPVPHKKAPAKPKAPAPSADPHKKFRHSTPRKHGEVKFAPKSASAFEDQDFEERQFPEESRRPAYPFQFNNFQPVPHLSSQTEKPIKENHHVKIVQEKPRVNKYLEPFKLEKQYVEEYKPIQPKAIVDDTVVRRLVVVARQGLKIKDPAQSEKSTSSEQIEAFQKGQYESVKFQPTESTKLYTTAPLSEATTTLASSIITETTSSLPVTRRLIKTKKIRPTTIPTLTPYTNTEEITRVPYEATRVQQQEVTRSPYDFSRLQEDKASRVQPEIPRVPYEASRIQPDIPRQPYEASKVQVDVTRVPYQASRVQQEVTRQPYKGTTLQHRQKQQEEQVTKATEDLGFDVYGRSPDEDEEEELIKAAQEYLQASEQYGKRKRPSAY